MFALPNIELPQLLEAEWTLLHEKTALVSLVCSADPCNPRLQLTDFRCSDRQPHGHADLVAADNTHCDLYTGATHPFPTPEPLPPLADMEENLLARIEAGEWTLETGLVTTLKLFVGEAGAAEVNPAGRALRSNELNGIANLAAGYVENGQDAATKTELQRLLDMIFPAPE